MGPHVPHKCSLFREPSIALFTLKWAFSSVAPYVDRELLRGREAHLAARVRARISNKPKVGAEMRLHGTKRGKGVRALAIVVSIPDTSVWSGARARLV